MNVNVYDIKGKEVGKMDLNDAVFGQEFNAPLIHQVVVAQLANKRQGTKCTLTRSEVRGGGKKPWRQKGTGRARQGSIRAPQWVKGGVVFAPKPRDFSQKINKSMNRAALISALSKKLADGEIVIIDNLAVTAPKTKEVAQIMKNFDNQKKTLFVLGGSEEAKKKEFVIAAKNIQAVSTIDAAQLNVYDLVANAKCFMAKAAVEKIMEVLA